MLVLMSFSDLETWNMRGQTFLMVIKIVPFDVEQPHWQVTWGSGVFLCGQPCSHSESGGPSVRKNFGSPYIHAYVL